MDANEAREIIELINFGVENGGAFDWDKLEKIHFFYNADGSETRNGKSWSPVYNKAQGFIEGWNAAIKKSVEIAKRHESDPELGEFGICSQQILNLSVSSESKEPEKKSPQEEK